MPYEKIIFFARRCRRLVSGVASANALNTPPGDYGRKIKTQRNCGEAAQAVEYVV